MSELGVDRRPSASNVGRRPPCIRSGPAFNSFVDDIAKGVHNLETGALEVVLRTRPRLEA